MPQTEYSGYRLVDEGGHQVGQVNDVIYDGSESTPSWLVVRAGRFRGDHYVPAQGAHRTDDGDIVVPFSAQIIKSAPKARGDHVLDKEMRSRLTEHYRLETGPDLT